MTAQKLIEYLNFMPPNAEIRIKMEENELNISSVHVTSSATFGESSNDSGNLYTVGLLVAGDVLD